MISAMTRPAPETISDQARRIRESWLADPEMKTVLDGCAKYSSDWDDFYGGPLVSNYRVEKDARPLLLEAVKALSRK